MASASAAAAPSKSRSASAAAAPQSTAPRGRVSSRTPPSKEDVAAQMTDVPKRGRSATRTPAISGRDETPEFPLEGSMLISDIANIANKKAKRSGPHKIMRNHYRENPNHFRARRNIVLPISKRRPT